MLPDPVAAGHLKPLRHEIAPEHLGRSVVQRDRHDICPIGPRPNTATVPFVGIAAYSTACQGYAVPDRRLQRVNEVRDCFRVARL